MLYLVSMLIMFSSIIAYFFVSEVYAIICLLLMMLSSSFILFSKTFDWRLVLALKRKKLDKIVGIHTGCYFVFIMTVSVLAYLTPIIYMLILFDNTKYRLSLIGFLFFTLLSYYINLRNAYKCDPDDVVNEIINDYNSYQQMNKEHDST